MKRTAAWALGVVICGALGCSQGSIENGPELGRSSARLSVCDEEVPEDRYIDGFPAYAQCDGSENEAIYSNNGIDTATSSQGDDWVRTQFSGGYQCTELANRYLYFKWAIDWQPRGNAGFWCDEEPPEDSGLVLTQVPVHGDVLVLAPGSCGADGTTGHVALVDEYDAESERISAVQQNSASRGRFELSCAKCFVHVVANDGAAPAPTLSGGSDDEPAPSDSGPDDDNGSGDPPPEMDEGEQGTGGAPDAEEPRPGGRPIAPLPTTSAGEEPDPAPSASEDGAEPGSTPGSGAPVPPVNEPAPTATSTTPPGFVPPKQPVPVASTPETPSSPDPSSQTPGPEASAAPAGSSAASDDSDDDESGCAVAQVGLASTPATSTRPALSAVVSWFALALLRRRSRSRGRGDDRDRTA